MLASSTLKRRRQLQQPSRCVRAPSISTRGSSPSRYANRSESAKCGGTSLRRSGAPFIAHLEFLQTPGQVDADRLCADGKNVADLFVAQAFRAQHQAALLADV